MNLKTKFDFTAKALENSLFPALIVEKNGKIVEVNNQLFGKTNYSSDDLLQQNVFNTLFQLLTDNEISAILNGQTSSTIKKVNVLAHDEQLLPTSILVQQGQYNNEDVLLISFLPSDVDIQHDDTHNLADFKRGIESSFMTVTLDAEGFINGCNNLFLKTSNWTPKRVLGKTLWRLFPDTDEGRTTAQTIWDTLNGGSIYQGDVEKATKDGQSYWTHLTAIPTFNEDSNEKQFVFIEKDITKDKTIQVQLERIAFIDTETGLMNIHRLEREISEMIAEQRHFSFVYISIDKFYTLKDIQNDTPESNLILEFTKRLKMYFQDSTMARINEHEFVVITPLPEWFIQGFLTYLVQNPIYDSTNAAAPVSISGGITRYPEDQSTFTQLMKASLATIANVREAGGNRIVSLSRTMQQALNRKSIIEKRLLIALDQKNLQVLYQPQLHVTTGQITAVEALVRWEDEEIGVVAPDELIPIAEETGLINRIGNFMLERACEQAVAWKKAGYNIKVGINSSVREFRDKNMAKSILETLEKTNCPANLLQIEITEKFAFEAESETSIIKQMRQLENEGITFSLDDFGTGYASFRYMQLLPIQSLKIDQTFTNALLKSDKTQQLVDGMVQLGKSMNLAVVAEGVETEEQLELLKSFGCDMIQGYYLSKPSTADTITKLL
ncbi:MAG: EAL domain-containing protein [Lysinibacillus sp.]